MHRHPTLVLPVLAALGLAGCAVDYGIVTQREAVPTLWTELGGGPPDVDAAGHEASAGDDEAGHDLGDEGELQMRLDVAFQRNRWGTHVSRCQVQLSFEERFTDPDAEPSEGGGGTMIEMPDEPGECALTRLDPDEDGGHHDDNWYESGELFGPDEVYLTGLDDELRLDLVAAEDGKLRYELSNCQEDSFPFGQVLDLEVPTTDGGNLPELIVPEALVVGAEVVLVEPGPDDLGETEHLYLGAGEDLRVVWETMGDDPETSDGVIAPTEDVRIQNALHQGPTIEYLVCKNAERGLVDIPGSLLAELSFNPAEGQEYDTNFDVHVVTEGPEFEAPWGQLVRVRSTISAGGSLYLE